MIANDIDRTPVAKDIITDCSRCKLELNHIVVRHNAKGIVDRVKCHTCGFEHKYKPVKKKAATTRKRKSPVRKKSPEKEYEELMEKNTDVTPIPYSMKASFISGHTALSDKLDPFNIPAISIPFSMALNARVPGLDCLRKIRPGSTMAMIPPGLAH